MSKELEQAYHDTAIDAAIDGNQEMYDFYMDMIVELTKIPKELLEHDPSQLTNHEIEENEKTFTKFLKKKFGK